MKDLTNLFAKVNILRHEKGSRGSHKIVKTCSFVYNDPYSIVFLVYTTGIPSYTPDVLLRCIY